MKNAIKKIAAVTMAFTLLGTGTAVTKTINPKFDTAITASAAYCNHVVGSSSYGEWYEYQPNKSNLDIIIDVFTSEGRYHYYKQPVRCVKCKKILWYRCQKKIPYEKKLGKNMYTIAYYNESNYWTEKA